VNRDEEAAMAAYVESFFDAFSALISSHIECRWEQVGDYVGCADHGVRLYQGTVPEEKQEAT
jgi:hypothetical protein